MAEIKDYAEPLNLYRYRSCDSIGREIAALTEKHIFCSSYEDKNDPTEGMFSYSQAVKDVAPDFTGKLDPLIEADLKKTGFASFSESHRNELMWAHYTNQSKGFCVGYSLRRMIKYFPENVKFSRLYYQDEVTTVREVNLVGSTIPKFLLSTKSLRWQYEREWRMFSDSVGKVSYGKGECIKSIFLGLRIDPDHESLFMRQFSASSIRMYKMYTDGYRIKFRRLNPK